MYAEWLVIERKKDPIRVFVRRRSMYFRVPEAVLGGQRERETDLNERDFEQLGRDRGNSYKLSLQVIDCREQDDRSQKIEAEQKIRQNKFFNYSIDIKVHTSERIE